MVDDVLWLKRIILAVLIDGAANILWSKLLPDRSFSGAVWTYMAEISFI